MSGLDIDLTWRWPTLHTAQVLYLRLNSKFYNYWANYAVPSFRCLQEMFTFLLLLWPVPRGITGYISNIVQTFVFFLPCS